MENYGNKKKRVSLKEISLQLYVTFQRSEKGIKFNMKKGIKHILSMILAIIILIVV